jgi:molecular chaperone GrpE
MTDSDRTTPADAGAPATGAHVSAATDEGAAVERTADLEAEVAALKDHLLRAVAEQDNIRKRGQREIDDTRKYAVSGFARELLVVADNLRRALEAAPKDPDPAMKNFLIGIEATERGLLSAFEKAGIRKLEPVGQPADPNFHQIMMEVDGGDAAPLTVMQVLQDGYVIQDRLLRAALVAVARRPVGAAAPPPGPQV